jgi:hypothetical protein
MSYGLLMLDLVSGNSLPLECINSTPFAPPERFLSLGFVTPIERQRLYSFYTPCSHCFISVPSYLLLRLFTFSASSCYYVNIFSR